MGHLILESLVQLRPIFLEMKKSLTVLLMMRWASIFADGILGMKHDGAEGRGLV
jgi:hypothetical protein